MKAQSFQETQKYIFETGVKENRVEDTYFLQRWGGTTGYRITFDINDLEIFEDILITTLEFPSNKGISEVFKMTLDILLELRNNRFVFQTSHKIIISKGFTLC